MDGCGRGARGEAEDEALLLLLVVVVVVVERVILTMAAASLCTIAGREKQRRMGCPSTN